MSMGGSGSGNMGTGEACHQHAQCVCDRLLAYHEFGSEGLKTILLVCSAPAVRSNHRSLNGIEGTLSDSRESLIRFDAP